MINGKRVLDFFYTSQLLYPTFKFRLRLIRTKVILYMIRDNLNRSLAINDCSICTRHIALQYEYQTKRRDVFWINPVEYMYLETLATHCIILVWPNQFFQKKLLSKLQFVKLLLRQTNTLQSLDRWLDFHSHQQFGLKHKSIRKFNQLYTLMRL